MVGVAAPRANKTSAIGSALAYSQEYFGGEHVEARLDPSGGSRSDVLRTGVHRGKGRRPGRVVDHVTKR
jgi:hypothetical protein